MIRALALFIAIVPPLGLLFVPLLACAQSAPAPVQPNPEATALGQMVMDAAQREAGLRVQLNAALAKAASLEAAAKPPPAPPEPPK